MILKLLNVLLKRMPPLLVLLLALSAGWLASSALIGRRFAADPLHAGLTIERLSEVSQLLTLKLDLADVLVSRIDGYTGGVQTAILVKGDVCLGVDLSQARFQNVEEARRTATLIMPAPTASGPRLDHDRTKIVSLDVTGLWCVVPGTYAEQAIVNKAMKEAQQSLATAAGEKDADQRARRHAEALLTAFCRALGWHLTVRWYDQLTAE